MIIHKKTIEIWLKYIKNYNTEDVDNNNEKWLFVLSENGDKKTTKRVLLF